MTMTKNLFAGVCVVFAGCAAVLCHAAQTSLGSKQLPIVTPRIHSGPGANEALYSHYRELGHELAAIYRRSHARGAKEKLSDFAEEERILLERIALMPNVPEDRLSLAQVYERDGRTMDALTQWKMVAAPSNRSWSSALQDVRVLTHFGDLAFHVGEYSMATELYGKAGGWVFRSGEADSDLATDSLQNLRMAAHFAAAEAHVPHGELQEALADFKIGMPILSRSEAAHLEYGRLLRRMDREAESKKEYVTAERLAPDTKTKRDVHNERLRLGLIRTESISVIDNGKLKNIIREIPDKGH